MGRPLICLVGIFVVASCSARNGGGSAVGPLDASSSMMPDSGALPEDGGGFPEADSGSDAPGDASPAVADAGAGGGAFDGSGDSSADAEPAGVFVAVGYGGRRMRSTDDGRTWIDDQSLEPDGGGDDTDLLRSVSFGAGMFVAAGWQTLSSPDGRTWSPLPPTNQNWFGALVYANPIWVAVGGYGMRLTSPDAMTWTNHSIDTTAAHPHGCLAFADAPVRGFVACNDSGARSRSSDGVTWTYASGALDVPSSQVVAGAGVFVGVDGAQVVVSQDGGNTWALAATLDVAGGGLVFAQGHFTYLATDAVYTSADGTSWDKHAATGVRPAPLAYGHGAYVAVQGHAWQRSDDGVTWEPAVTDTSQVNSFEWVTFGATVSDAGP